MRQIILLALALVAGVLAFFFSKQYLDSRERQLSEGYSKRLVVIAARDIPAGATLTIAGGMLDRALLPSAMVTRGGAVPYEQDAVFLLEKRRTSRFLAQGSVILWSDLEGARGRATDLSDRLDKGDIVKKVLGLRAVSIPVDLVSSVTQMVYPNDRVDIIATFTFPSSKPDPSLDTITLTILQDVLVLATGKVTTMDMDSPAFLAQQTRGNVASGYSTVTLEVTPQEAEILAFAIRRGGSLMLSLRNREDVGIVWKPQSINFEYIEKHISELNPIRQERMHRAAPPTETP